VGSFPAFYEHSRGRRKGGAHALSPELSGNVSEINKCGVKQLQRQIYFSAFNF